MLQPNWKDNLKAFDERRDLIVPGDQKQTIQFCVDHFITVANEAINSQGIFTVALSGGSTPKTIYQQLANEKNRSQIDWSKVFLFWGDERCVPMDHPESNYRMAMEAGFATLPIPKSHIFPMPATGDVEQLEQGAEQYEKLIVQHVPKCSFDLVMLGMGEDGHTASLFPKTHGLHTVGKLVIANYIPQKQCWRMTLTYECINDAKNIAIYVLGESKAKMVKEVFTTAYDPDTLPIQKIGTPTHKALWIVEQSA